MVRLEAIEDSIEILQTKLDHEQIDKDILPNIIKHFTETVTDEIKD